MLHANTEVFRHDSPIARAPPPSTSYIAVHEVLSTVKATSFRGNALGYVSQAGPTNA